MKKSKKIAFCSMMSALAILFLFMTWFPYATYTITAIAGLFIAIVAIEINLKYALISYAVTAVIAYFIPDKEAWVIFIAFLGYYPALKLKLDQIRRKVPRVLLKLAIFNVAIILAEFAVIHLFAIPFKEMAWFGQWTAAVLLLLGNITFVILDYAFSKLYLLYDMRLHPIIQKMLK